MDKTESNFIEKDLQNDLVGFLTIKFDESNVDMDLDEKEKLTFFISKNLLKEKFDLNSLDENLISKIRQNSDFFSFLISKSAFFYLSRIDAKICKTALIKVENFLLKFEELINMVTWKDNSFIGFDNDSSFLYSSNNIIDTFKRIKKDGESIVFMNLYKGVPVKSKAFVVDINDGAVTFKLENELQGIAMKIDGKAFILTNDYFSKYIKADISYINFLDKSVVLENFIYLLNMPTAEREYIRVYPDILAKVMLNTKDEVAIEGKLFDLSENGLGVASEECSNLQAGYDVNVSFDLDTYRCEKINGKVMNIIKYDNSYKYCIKIFPNRTAKKQIVNYVQRREDEIVLELKNELSNYI